MAVVVSLTTIMSVFTNNNLSILWHKGDDEQKLIISDLLILLHLIGGGILCLVMILFVYDQWLIWVLIAIAFFMDSFHLKNKWILEKNKSFSRVSVINSAALIGSYVFMLCTVEYWPNSLGLSLVVLVAAVLRVLLFKPTFRLVVPKMVLLKPFIKEYRDLILLSGLNSFIWNMDKWIVLRLYGYNTLGMYSRLLTLIEMPLKASSAALSKLRLVYFIESRNRRRESNYIVVTNVILNSVLMVFLVVYAEKILALVNIPLSGENLDLYRLLIWIFPARILIRDLDTYFKSSESRTLSIYQKFFVIGSFILIYALHSVLVVNSINLMVTAVGLSSLLYLISYGLVQKKNGD